MAGIVATGTWLTVCEKLKDKLDDTYMECNTILGEECFSGFFVCEWEVSRGYHFCKTFSVIIG